MYDVGPSTRFDGISPQQEEAHGQPILQMLPANMHLLIRTRFDPIKMNTQI